MYFPNSGHRRGQIARPLFPSRFATRERVIVVATDRRLDRIARAGRQRNRARTSEPAGWRTNGQRVRRATFPREVLGVRFAFLLFSVQVSRDYNNGGPERRMRVTRMRARHGEWRMVRRGRR